MGTNCVIKFEKHPHIMLYKSKNGQPIFIKPMLKKAIKYNTSLVLKKKILQSTQIVAYLISNFNNSEWKLLPEDFIDGVDFEYTIKENGKIEVEDFSTNTQDILRERIKEMISKHSVIICQQTDNETWLYSDYNGSNSIRIPYESGISTQIERWQLNGEKLFEIDIEFLSDLVS